MSRSRHLPTLPVALLLLVITGPVLGREAAGTGVAVHVGHIERATVHRWVVAYGHVEPAPAGSGRPAGSASLSAPRTGVVAEVLCAEGQRVHRGDLLFRLASPQIDTDVDYAARAAAREHELLGTGGTSEKAVQQADGALARARAEQALYRVEAPFDGIVTRVAARPGEAVDSNRVLGEMFDPARLVVTLGVPAGEAVGLEPGETALISTGGDAAAVRATIDYVSPQVDPGSGLARVRAALEPGSGLRSGEFVRARIAAEAHADALTVPASSVVEAADGSAVFLVDGNVARRHRVERGLRDGDVVEIRGQGLAEGMPVVTEGAYGLPDDSPIRRLP